MCDDNFFPYIYLYCGIWSGNRLTQVDLEMCRQIDLCVCGIPVAVIILSVYYLVVRSVNAVGPAGFPTPRLYSAAVIKRHRSHRRVFYHERTPPWQTISTEAAVRPTPNQIWSHHSQTPWWSATAMPTVQEHYVLCVRSLWCRDSCKVLLGIPQPVA